MRNRKANGSACRVAKEVFLALGTKDRGELKNNQVVTTVMSNMGFESYLSNKEIHLIRANVGDRYVLEKMKELDVKIGGEQSGHIILSDFGTTGDGVLIYVKLVEAIRDSGVIVKFIEEKELEMAGLRRVLVRTSGTEPIVRVMVEGEEMSTVEKVAKEIAAVVEKQLI